jgi:triacylglycerol lipase
MNCDSKYPIFMIHGTGFRDRKFLNYWGRIPAALQEQGATLYYGHQDSWGSVEYNAVVLKDNLNKILAETNSERVNIIAHSKGGVDARYMISSLDMAEKIASLTTIATTHHGSKTIDLLCKLPNWLYVIAAFFTNLFFRMLGDKKPDFYTVSRQFGTAHMKTFNERNPDAPGIYYQSYAAVMRNPFSDIFLFWPNLIVGWIEGENDGLVTPESAAWTNFKGVLRGTTRRGISHADEVDARRMNFTKKSSENGISDIRNVYIAIVSELKQMGL